MAKQLYTLLIAVIFLLTASIAVGQDNDGFCDMRSNGLLAELEGTWMFEQKAGYGVGGSVLPFPLPPQPPQQVTLDYDPERGVMFMRHAGESLALIEVSFDYSEAGVFFLSSEEKEILRSQATICDQNRVPTLIGTNSYAMDGSYTTDNKIIVSDGNFTLEACSKIEPLSDASDEIAIFDTEGNLLKYIGLGVSSGPEDFEPEDWSDIEDEYRNRECIGDYVEGVPGQIVLSLVLQFGASDWASGVIQFMVRIPGVSRGTARAPVTLTRVGG